MTEHEIVTAYRTIRAKVKDPLVNWRDPRQTLIAGYASRDAEVAALLKTMEMSGDLLLKFQTQKPIPVTPETMPPVTKRVLLWNGDQWVTGYWVDGSYWKTEDYGMEYDPAFWCDLPPIPESDQ